MGHKERPAYKMAVECIGTQNETRQLEAFKVQRHRILGTRIMVYAAWERSSVMGKHSTITTIDGEWYGRVGTRHLPAWMNALPAMSDERSRIVGEYHDAQYGEAYDIIRRAFPEVCEYAARESMGELETT